MTFTVSATGRRSVEVETFQTLDEAIRYFKLAYALSNGMVSLTFDPLAEEFYWTKGSQGDEYVTSEQRCSCPSFVYSGVPKAACKHMKRLSDDQVRATKWDFNHAVGLAYPTYIADYVGIP